MKLPSRLAKSRHGVFYFRLSFIAGGKLTLADIANAQFYEQRIRAEDRLFQLIFQKEMMLLATRASCADNPAELNLAARKLET